ncbi:MAG: class II fructose-bisphosphate aldolase [Scardovia wiggsiae]|uniref:class II fructose-bisphosphate aldolase n=1 Tax=Scardovia wiggsiae TaxID=230143 RepID=UPI001CAAC4FE|nr:class II fructose-bisphosphate aldolase [Scardovia wiggsiae]
MTIATPERYAEMLDAARKGGYAYPAINVTSTQTLNAALQGFADAQSDGIIQISVGSAAYLSGQRVNDRVTGSMALARYAHEVAKHYTHNTVALHTDHCAKQYLDEWVRPILAIEQDEVSHGQEPTFQSHMWDGSAISLEENLDIAEKLLAESVKAHTVLEIEIGAVGGEEDGITGAIDDKLYSTPEDAFQVAQRLGMGEKGRYMAAFTFGNVHGSYKPGYVKLRPGLLGKIQSETQKVINRGLIPQPSEAPDGKPFLLVFHGGSGSLPAEIAEAVSYGVVKMNVDTDTQYAFTRAIAGHMFSNYDKVLKIDDNIGDKAEYDPRSWGREAEDSMAARVIEACTGLGSAGKALR